MRARDQSSIFSTGGKFRSDYGLLLELHALTLVAHALAYTNTLFSYTISILDLCSGNSVYYSDALLYKSSMLKYPYYYGYGYDYGFAT